MNQSDTHNLTDGMESRRVEKLDAEEVVDAWKALFKHIQAHPNSASINDEDIAEEIAAYRRDRALSRPPQRDDQ